MKESTTSNPRSDTKDTQNRQPPGSKGNRSLGVYAANNGNVDLGEDDHPLRSSKMNELRNPAKPFDQNELNLDETMVANEDCEKEGYHKSFIGFQGVMKNESIAIKSLTVTLKSLHLSLVYLIITLSLAATASTFHKVW